MTIKDVAARTGLSHQAIYKRLKARGLSASALKDKESGHLTEEGERLLAEMFSLQAEEITADTEPTETSEHAQEAEESGSEELRNQVAELTTQVEKLTTEVEKLRNQVATLEEKNSALTEERDFLRVALDRSQQLQAITASKIPNPPPRLPASEAEESSHKGLLGSVRSWWSRRRERKREADDGREA